LGTENFVAPKGKVVEAVPRLSGSGVSGRVVIEHEMAPAPEYYLDVHASNAAAGFPLACAVF